MSRYWPLNECGLPFCEVFIRVRIDLLITLTLYFPGVGRGCIFDPGSAVLGEYFQHGYGLPNGFTLLGASLAVVVFAPLREV